MKLKPNYFIIPLITILVAFLGSLLTTSGMNWYDTELIRPEITPPDWAFPLAWNLIFILTTIAALVVYNKSQGKRRLGIVIFFIANAVLNVLWSLLFFKYHLILPAFIEMIVLNLTTVVLIAINCKVSKLASWLLLPYFLWVSFATYLTYLIYQLNN